MATTVGLLDRLARRLNAAESLRSLQPGRYQSRLQHIMREAEDADLSFEQIAARADELAATAAQAVTPIPAHRRDMQLIAYRYTKGDGHVHVAMRSATEAERFVAALPQLHAELLGQAAFPANWSELGSSAKDLWQDRIVASFVRAAARGNRA